MNPAVNMVKMEVKMSLKWTVMRSHLWKTPNSRVVLLISGCQGKETAVVERYPDAKQCGQLGTRQTP